MTSGEKWTRNLTSPSRSELTSKSSSDDIVNIKVPHCPADHIFIWPFHNQIIRSIMSLHKFNRWAERNFLRTYQSEKELRAISIDKDSLYVSTLFNPTFSRIKLRLVREAENVKEYIKMKQRHNFHSPAIGEWIWSKLFALWIHKRAISKRREDNEGCFEQIIIGSIKKRTLWWKQLCIYLIDWKFALILLKSSVNNERMTNVDTQSSLVISFLFR